MTRQFFDTSLERFNNELDTRGKVFGEFRGGCFFRDTGDDLNAFLNDVVAVGVVDAT